eukprot:TRINITY_DN6979_c0_g1_i2.p1 TRINITY_DN6979_c0_g1~~TRINITY_DN6979_c0_g1_i2.p1  ORF type:complete len:329 (+),score=34.87 TRINITY_DN6979_c0_g1_i2:120-1106(+)
MGVCRCKKKTNLFCYNHKKFVCKNCLLEEHCLCHISTYENWLEESDFEPTACGLCKKVLEEPVNVIRLTCIDIFHLSCLDAYGASLPANTALAGFSCPTCRKPMVPSREEDRTYTELAKDVLAKLQKFDWIAKQLESFSGENDALPSEPSNPPVKVSHPVSKVTVQSQINAPLQQSKSNTNLDQNSVYSAHSTIGRTDPVVQDDSNKTTDNTGDKNFATNAYVDFELNLSGGIKDRKLGVKNVSTSQHDAEENKYRKRSFLRLFELLGLITRVPPSRTTKGGPKLNYIRLFSFLGLIVFVVLIVTLSTYVLGDGEQNLDGINQKEITK